MRIQPCAASIVLLLACGAPPAAPNDAGSTGGFNAAGGGAAGGSTGGGVGGGSVGGSGGGIAEPHDAGTPDAGLPDDSCHNGIDDDGDGLIDFPLDPGCLGPTTGSESADPLRKRTVAYRELNANTADATAWRDFDNISVPWILSAGEVASTDPVKAKAYLDQYPPDLRAVFSWNYQERNGTGYPCDAPPFQPWLCQNGVWSTPADDCRAPDGGATGLPCPWMEGRLADLRSRFGTFFNGLRDAGGTLEALVFDEEGFGALNDAATWDAIQADPRFTQPNPAYPVGDVLNAPLSQAIGATQLNTLTGCGAAPCWKYLETFFSQRYLEYLHRGTVEPLLSAFPNAHAVSWDATQADLRHWFTPDFGSEADLGACPPNGVVCPDGLRFGTHQHPVILYGWAPFAFTSEETPVLLDGKQAYPWNQYSGLRAIVHRMRANVLSAPDRPLAPVLAGIDYSYTGPGLVSTEYYYEGVFHALAMGAEFLTLWNPTYIDSEAYALSKAMHEFDAVAGFAGRHTRVSESERASQGLLTSSAFRKSWTDDLLITGIDTGGRTVWRVTPDVRPARADGTAEQSAVSVLVSESPPTFRSRQVQVVFPDGVLFRPAQPVSSLGYWVVQPAGAADPTYTDLTDNPAPTARVIIRQQLGAAPTSFAVNAQLSYDENGYITRYEWDLDGDGQFGVTPLEQAVSAGNGQGYIYANLPPHPASTDYTIKVRVWDNEGKYADAAATASVAANASSCAQVCQQTPSGQQCVDDCGMWDTWWSWP